MTSATPRRRLAQQLALALNGALALGYVALWLTLASSAWQSDFTTFYSVATMVLAGDGARIYQNEVLALYQQRVLAGLFEVRKAIEFINPPPVALLVAPLGWLPRGVAYWVWTALQFGLLGWSLWLADRTARHWSSGERRLLLVTIAAAPPLLITLVLGTLSLLLLLCLWQVSLAVLAGQQRRAGLWLALGLVKPQLWPLIGLLLLSGRQWWAVAWTAVAGLSAAVATTLLLGPSIWLEWLELVRPSLNQRADVGAMYTLRGNLTLLLGNDWAVAVSQLNLVLLGLAALVVVRLWWGAPPTKQPQAVARLALTATLGLFLSPYLYPHDSLMLVVPATLGYLLARPWPRARLIYGGLALATPLLTVINDNLLGMRIGVHLPVLLTLGLIGWLAWLIRRGEALPTASDRGSASAAAGD